MKRPEYDKLVTAVDAGEVDAIIVTDETAQDRAVASLLAAVKDMEAAHQSERLRAAARARREKRDNS